jgi:hypothetical protein
MYYKIPIYVELKVEGDFAPMDLNEAVDKFVAEKVHSIIKEKGGFPLDSKNDVFDSTAEQVRKASKTKRVKISLISKTTLLKKIS